MNWTSCWYCKGCGSIVPKCWWDTVLDIRLVLSQTKLQPKFIYHSLNIVYQNKLNSLSFQSVHHKPKCKMVVTLSTPCSCLYVIPVKLYTMGISCFLCHKLESSMLQWGFVCVSSSIIIHSHDSSCDLIPRSFYIYHYQGSTHEWLTSSLLQICIENLKIVFEAHQISQKWQQNISRWTSECDQVSLQQSHHLRLVKYFTPNAIVSYMDSKQLYIPHSASSLVMLAPGQGGNSVKLLRWNFSVSTGHSEPQAISKGSILS